MFKVYLSTFFVFILTTWAQAQVVSTEFTTGHLENITGSPREYYTTDSSLFIQYFGFRQGKFVNNLVEFSKNNLSKLKEETINTEKSDPNFGETGIRIADSLYPRYIFRYEPKQITFFRCKKNAYAIADTLFVHSLTDSLIVRNISIDFYQNRLYVYYMDGTDFTTGRFSDTSHILVFDTLGGLINSRYYTYNDPTKNQLTSSNILMQKYPPDESLLLLSELDFGELNHFLVNRSALDTVRTIKQPFSFLFDRGYQGPWTTNLFVDKDGFQFAGFTEIREVQGTRFVYNEQAFVYRANWQGDSLELRNFGNPNLDERSYAYAYTPNFEQQYLSTSTPWNDFRILGNENRAVVIYNWNRFGQDSLVLFGQSNHVALGIHPDKNGDLFVIGSRHNWQGNDSCYVWLAKIPNFALELMEAKIMEPRLSLYPNPAQDFLKVDNWPKDWPSTVDYKIIGTGAQTFKTGVMAQNEALVINSLKPGTYILQLTFQGAQHNILWNKQ
jgi:hypothetical protein